VKSRQGERGILCRHFFCERIRGIPEKGLAGRSAPLVRSGKQPNFARSCTCIRLSFLAGAIILFYLLHAKAEMAIFVLFLLSQQLDLFSRLDLGVAYDCVCEIVFVVRQAVCPIR
jgi:hypothetical protein